MIKQNPSFIIGVAGGTGSGKTTIVSQLQQMIQPQNVAMMAHDSYYKDNSHLPPEERVTINYDHPLSLETKLLIEHLKELKDGRSVQQPVYDFVNHVRSNKTVEIQPNTVILVEGILIFESKKLRELFDLKIFVDTDSDIRFIRRLQRDIHERGRVVESVIEQYLQSVKPMHDEFVEPSKRYADIIIPEGVNMPALDLIKARLHELLSS